MNFSIPDLSGKVIFINLESGAYYEPVGKETKLSFTVRDTDLATRLWDWTEEQLKVLNVQ